MHGVLLQGGDAGIVGGAGAGVAGGGAVADQGLVFRVGARASLDCRSVRESGVVFGVPLVDLSREGQGYDGYRC